MDKKNLIDFLKNQSMPLTLQEICNNYGDLKEVEVRKFLSELEDEKEVARYHGECGDTYFYVLRQGMVVEKQDNLETYLNLNKAQLRDMISVATKHAEKAMEATKGIYAEIIGIMSLFVAVFSLITINASIIPAIIGKATCEIIVICITVNISTIVSIIALVLAVRFWLIKPLQKSGAKK